MARGLPTPHVSQLGQFHDSNESEVNIIFKFFQPFVMFISGCATFYHIPVREQIFSTPLKWMYNLLTFVYSNVHTFSVDAGSLVYTGSIEVLHDGVCFLPKANVPCL